MPPRQSSRTSTPPPRSATKNAQANGNLLSGAQKGAKPQIYCRLWPWPVLTEAGKNHIAQHKYKPGVYTPLDNLLNGMWLRLTNLLPMWLAPNLVTFSGFIPMAIAYGLNWWNSPNFSVPPPQWMTFYAGLALLFYQTADAMDGKQARRTNNTTPLGQLLDHGFDGLACLAHHSTATMVLLPAGSRTGVLGLCALQTSFWMGQWQEYYTGVLSTCFGPIGVTETQYALMGVAFFASYLGPKGVSAMFAAKMTVPWWTAPLPVGLVCAQLWVLFCLLLMCGSLITTVPVARKAGKLGESLTHFIPMVGLNAAVFAWREDVLAQHTRLICMAIGCLFFYYTCQMIVFSMARMPFPVGQPTLVPIVLLSAFSHFDQTYAVQQKAILTCGLVFVAITVLWVNQIIKELKAKLGICCLTIPAKK